MNIKGAFGKVSGGNEKHAIRNLGRIYSHIVTRKCQRTWANCCSTVFRKSELVNDKLRCLAEEILNQVLKT